MSLSSDDMMDLREQQEIERREDWVRRELDNQDADESTPGWSELEEIYNSSHEGYSDYLQDEYEWHNSQDHSVFFVQFKQTLDDVRRILASRIDPLVVDTVYKMIHVHVVTAMETYLGDALKSAVLSKKELVNKAAVNLDELSKNKYSLADILKHEDGIKKIVSDQLSDYLYHNIPKVLNIYRSALDKDFTYNITNICKDTKIRHDIAHRNGGTISGGYVFVNNASLIDTISEIDAFITYIEGVLSTIERDNPFDDFNIDSSAFEVFDATL